MAIPPTPSSGSDPLVFTPAKIGSPNCDDGHYWGRPSSRFDYIMKGLTGDDVKYPEACEPWYHLHFQVDQIQLNSLLWGTGAINLDGTISALGEITSSTEVSCGSHELTKKKNFEISEKTCRKRVKKKNKTKSKIMGAKVPYSKKMMKIFVSFRCKMKISSGTFF